jgi:hypothetical protein
MLLLNPLWGIGRHEKDALPGARQAKTVEIELFDISSNQQWTEQIVANQFFRRFPAGRVMRIVSRGNIMRASCP